MARKTALKRYCVTMHEIHAQEVFVEAGSPQEAIAKVQDGEGDYGNGTRYLETLDSSRWGVEEDV